MNKYKVSLWKGDLIVHIIIEAANRESLNWFIDEFYPDTNWTYELL